MKKRMISTVSLLLCLVLVISFCITAFAEGEDAAMTCEKADSWNALFDRSGITNDWLAADGIYSVSLDGKDAIGSANAEVSDTVTNTVPDTPIDTPISSSDPVTPEPAVPKKSNALPIVLSSVGVLAVGTVGAIAVWMKRKRKN